MKFRNISIFSILIMWLSQSADASCDFRSADFLNQLTDPKSIFEISIEVLSQPKFFKNAYRILTSSDYLMSGNIDPKLRRDFEANVKVSYEFGACEFRAKVRQSGDLYDHIKLINGGFVARSLDVKLLEGNILNAVRFKLFLPETRNGASEILASIIMRAAGFVSPETAEVRVSVNGFEGNMIFQETTNKEMLERNERREGPIFEADEGLIWSYEDYEILELERLSLSRLQNANWARKSRDSLAISMTAHARLQDAYLDYVFKRKSSSFRFAIFPNRVDGDLFLNFHYLMLAMNGLHGLAANNRKFYFNAINSQFEPIYYDGDVNFDDPVTWRQGFSRLFPRAPSSHFTSKVESKSFTESLLEPFSKRVLLSTTEAENLFGAMTKRFLSNQVQLKNEIAKIGESTYSLASRLDRVSSYVEFQEEKKVAQLVIDTIVENGERFNAKSVSGEIFSLTAGQVSELISENKLSGARAVNLHSSGERQSNGARSISLIPEFGSIFISEGIEVDVDELVRRVSFKQTTPSDWVLLAGGVIDNWKISFEGLRQQDNLHSDEVSRFNRFGLTGCITLYETEIREASFDIRGGACEDSLNIIRSTGENISIVVSEAFSDGVDFDFSTLSIARIQVDAAANDCLDVSAGRYTLSNATLSGCGDKGLSAGEKSVVVADTLLIRNAAVAVAAKDLSIVEISDFDASEVRRCGDAYQKKQEFGGASLSFLRVHCDGPFSADIDSHVSWRKH